MKLTDNQKVTAMSRLWDITNACYAGAELPTYAQFERLVKQGDVFVWNTRNTSGYALVTPHDLTNVPLLVSIAVIPDMRGCGIGGDLLREVSTYYRNHGNQSILLHVKVDNPAQKLYFDEGYRVTAYLRDYYKPEGDGLEMRKVL